MSETPAQTRAQHAHAAFDEAVTAVSALEAKPATSPEDLMQARHRRSDLVQTWRREADSWAKATPQNPAAKAEVAAAKKAQDKYVMPTGGLAPP